MRDTDKIRKFIKGIREMKGQKWRQYQKVQRECMIRGPWKTKKAMAKRKLREVQVQCSEAGQKKDGDNRDSAEHGA